ncbi:hypothetical protein B6A27_16260 [Anoxybacillus sp. UARK-01]|nr:hypothetical protein B6A27_16260 [Anoxybacillus sp. UARK-01]
MIVFIHQISIKSMFVQNMIQTFSYTNSILRMKGGNSMSQYGGSYNNGFVLIVVLFILLIIVGASLINY